MPKKSSKKQKVESSSEPEGEEEDVPSELDDPSSGEEGQQLGYGEEDDELESGEMDLDDELVGDGDEGEEGEEEME